MKRIAALGVGAALVLSLTLPAAAAGRTTFPDIQGHWAQATVEKWASYGMVQGDAETDTFRPDDYLTRAEFAALLDRVIGYKEGDTLPYPDVDPQEWYVTSLAHLNAAGVINGYLDGTIRPNEDVSRQEAAVMICRAFHIAPDPVHVHFLDRTWVDEWAENYVGALHNLGVIQGYDGRFEPRHPITRAQAVTILDNLAGGVVAQAGVWGRNAEGSLLVNTAGVTLGHITVGQNLFVSEGVGDGEVSLSYTRVGGDVILHSGGAFRILSSSTVDGGIIVDKYLEGDIRISSESGKDDFRVSVNRADGQVVLEGSFDSVTVNCDAPVLLRKGTVKSLTVNASGARVTVEKESTVSQAELTAEAKDTLLTVAGTVQALTTRAEARVDNSGRLSKVTVAADGLVLDGTKPSSVTVEKGIDRPKDGKGNTVYGSGSGR